VDSRNTNPFDIQFPFLEKGSNFGTNSIGDILIYENDSKDFYRKTNSSSIYDNKAINNDENITLFEE
jgi:hypothetical protein